MHLKSGTTTTCLIDECTVSDLRELSWYCFTHKNMLGLVEVDRSLASDDYLDELIDRYLKAHLSYVPRNTAVVRLGLYRIG